MTTYAPRRLAAEIMRRNKDIVHYASDDVLGDWWIVKRLMAKKSFVPMADISPGKVVKPAKREHGQFPIRVRFKARTSPAYSVSAYQYEVKTSRNPAIIDCEKPLHFNALGKAVSGADAIVAVLAEKLSKNQNATRGG